MPRRRRWLPGERQTGLPRPIGLFEAVFLEDTEMDRTLGTRHDCRNVKVAWLPYRLHLRKLGISA